MTVAVQAFLVLFVVLMMGMCVMVAWEDWNGWVEGDEQMQATEGGRDERQA